MHQLQRGQRCRLDAITPDRVLAIDVPAWDIDGAPATFLTLLVDQTGHAIDAGVVGAPSTTAVGGAVVWQAGGTDRGWVSVSLDHLPETVDRVVLAIGTETTSLAALHHGQVRISVGGQPVVAYDVVGADFTAERAIVAIELYRKDGWRVTAVGQGFDAGLTALLAAFGAGPLPASGTTEPAPPAVGPASEPSTPTPSATPAPAVEASPYGDMTELAWLEGFHAALEAQSAGDLTRALALNESMAERGVIQGMVSAGFIAEQLGDLDRSRRWSARAAELGDAQAAFNLGVLERRAGDPSAARRWFLRATDLGQAQGFAVLAQMSTEVGDVAGAKAYAQQGIEHGDPSSHVEYGDLLMAEDPDAFDRYEPHWRTAADLGHAGAMLDLGILNRRRKDMAAARAWLTRARDAGHPRAQGLLDQCTPLATRNDPRTQRIVAEWPAHSLDAAADLAAWREGVRLYQHDDYGSMMRCASLLAPALAHSLHGDGILAGADLPETVHKVLFASLSAPPDGRTFAESAQKAARLALTIARENGWQPGSMGGRGLFDPLIMDGGNYLLLSTALATGDQITGDLSGFLTR